MADIARALKSHARRLHREVSSGNPIALQRVRKLDAFKPADAAVIAGAVKRRHCLAIVARELGFHGWPHAVQVLSGTGANDVGTLLYPHRCGAHINIWCACYNEAKRIRTRHGGFLLGYRHQFLVVDEDYMTTLGIDPSDPDLDVIGGDWVGPSDAAARARLYGRVIDAAIGS